MRKKVCNAEYRIALFFPHIDHNLSAVFQIGNTVDCQRDRSPLVFANAAVVVGTEKGHASVFKQRHGAQIQTRRINVGGVQAKSAFHIHTANGGCDHAFFAVQKINLFAGLITPAGLKCFVAGSQKAFFTHFGYLALGFALIQKLFVVLAKNVCFFICLLILHCIFAGIQQPFFQLLCRFHHNLLLLVFCIQSLVCFIVFLNFVYILLHSAIRKGVQCNVIVRVSRVVQ